MEPFASIDTPHLRLVPATIEVLRAELQSPEALADAIGARVPIGWPPGVYDRDAAEFFLARLIEGGEPAAGWYSWYAILRPDGDLSPTLVASCGYFGPPADGIAEIGYSVVEAFRNRGIAAEMVEALVSRAFEWPGMRQVVAEVHQENAPSIAVLTRCGFRRIGAGRGPVDLRYAREMH